MKDDVWTKSDLQRCIKDSRSLIDRALNKIFPNTEIFVDDTITIREWKHLGRGSGINTPDAQHLAFVINLETDPFTEIVIGYWNKKKGNQREPKPPQFVRQKTLSNTGIWDPDNKKPVDYNHIYQIIAVHTSYQKCSSGDGRQIDITFEGFHSPKFKYSTQPSFQDPEQTEQSEQSEETFTNADTNVEDPSGTDKMIDLQLCDQAQTSQNLFGDSTQDSTVFTQDSQQRGVEPSKTDEEEFQTDILHFYPEIDFDYLNENKWPVSMFSFHRDSGKVSYSGNTTHQYFQKISRNLITDRLQSVQDMEFPVQKKRGLQMDDNFDYYLCELLDFVIRTIYMSV